MYILGHEWPLHPIVNRLHMGLTGGYAHFRSYFEAESSAYFFRSQKYHRVSYACILVTSDTAHAQRIVRVFEGIYTTNDTTIRSPRGTPGYERVPNEQAIVSSPCISLLSIFLATTDIYIQSRKNRLDMRYVR